MENKVKHKMFTFKKVHETIEGTLYQYSIASQIKDFNKMKEIEEDAKELDTLFIYNRLFIYGEN